ncbi:pyridoxamine 5'-phosphate oxidase family protein [Edaphobacter aggregans]|uniref:pyridoxamine 5'-phosphate oxidase family protein n=1 Tax=Edaphobacter aggregans TaxID=570835 RepID=UPI001B80BC54|nr:pyridoxamine 5'-phosphate oxidase family protein [Edaphobacter aggregans]
MIFLEADNGQRRFVFVHVALPLRVVSSISADGTPQSALVGIAVTPELEIIFDTVKSSRKYPNLIGRPACSFVVGWDGEQTVQFEGIAAEPTGPDLKRYQDLYFAVFTDDHRGCIGPASPIS